MAKNVSDMSKAEILGLLAQLVVGQIAQLESDQRNSAPVMSENNFPHYMQGQGKAIQNWRELLSYLKTCQNQKSQVVQDGALVKISGYPSAEWIFIYKFRSSLN